MPLINCEVNLILTWSKGCAIPNSTDVVKFKITETKLYLPAVTLSTQELWRSAEKANKSVKMQAHILFKLFGSMFKQLKCERITMPSI